jgi:epoxyqueuosine reductase
MTDSTALDMHAVKAALAAQARASGFDALGVASVELAEDERHLIEWLDSGFHGDMEYMERHGSMRSHPETLAPGTVRVVSVRMNYWPGEARDEHEVLADPALGYISRYALGRDYHKVMRKALARLAEDMARDIGAFGYRVCVDSAPVLEKALARNAGLGWIGKHTNLLARDAGSYFFLGEILTDLPLPIDTPASAHCGTCDACIPACPTQAILGPYRLDARRCISYLTIEHKGPIPEELAARMEGWVFGCDICNEVCPWNQRFAAAGTEPLFRSRGALAGADPELFERMDEAEFDRRFGDTPLARPGLAGMRRNVRAALASARAGASGG